MTTTTHKAIRNRWGLRIVPGDSVSYNPTRSTRERATVERIETESIGIRVIMTTGASCAPDDVVIVHIPEPDGVPVVDTVRFTGKRGNGRASYRADWSPRQPWALYLNGTATLHVATIGQAVAYFSGYGMTEVDA